MLLGAIDIGTNAVRLFLANVFEQNNLVVAEKASLVRVPLRLGEDVFTQGSVSESKTEDLIKTMDAFKLIMEVTRPEGFKAVATSAMREAKNGKETVEAVKSRTGIEIEIIDGSKEASLMSTVNSLRTVKKHKYVMFIDVGGGSTEISFLEDGQIVDSTSFRIGTVRLLNKKVDDSEWQAMQQWLLSHKTDIKDLLLVGSGGNINKLSKIYGRISENTLPGENLDYAIKHLELFSVQQRVELMGLRPDRADVIIPAGEIFQFILKQTGSTSIFVPKIGLSDGIVTGLYREMMKEN